MVYKVATKRKLIDVGIPEPLAYAMANDIQWYELVRRDFQGILAQLIIDNPYCEHDKFYDWRGKGIVVGRLDKTQRHTYTLPELYQFIQDAREREIARVTGLISYTASNYLIELQDWGAIPPNSPFAYITSKRGGFINWNVNPFNQKNSDI